MSIVSVILGSVRPNRVGLRVANYLKSSLEAQGFTVHLIDPKELNLPILTDRYSNLKNSPERPKALDSVAQKLQESDAIVIASPEYNGNIPPAISNTMDYFFSTEFYYKPAGICTYSQGPFGGARVGMIYPSFLNCCGLVPLPKQLPLPVVQNLLNEDGTIKDPASQSSQLMKGSTEKFIAELKWFTDALKAARIKGVPNL